MNRLPQRGGVVKRNMFTCLAQDYVYRIIDSLDHRVIEERLKGKSDYEL
jgi:hypothetical protein